MIHLILVIKDCMSSPVLFNIHLKILLIVEKQYLAFIWVLQDN